MKLYSIIFLAASVLLLSSCDIKKNDLRPEASFVRIFESAQVSDAFYPLSIVQTDDNGYLILSAIEDSVDDSNFPKPQLIYTDAEGSVLNSRIVDGYEAPVPGLMKIKGAYYFVCNNPTSSPVILEVNVSGNSIGVGEKTQLAGGGGSNYPLFAWQEGTDILLLSYDRVGWSSVISRYANFSANPVFSTSVSANDDYSEIVNNHLTRTGVQQPFFGGNIGTKDGYFVNCLENSSLTLVFLSEDGNVTGRLYSHQVDASLSSALFLRSDTFAISRFHTGDNFVYPSVGLDRSSTLNANNFQDIFISQLKSNAETKVVKYTYNDKDLIVYASTTKSDQIVLLFFNALTGKQLYTHYLGQGNPVEVKDLITTADGGLAVLGKTWINGQYQRVILFKIDKEQLDIKFDQ